MRMASFVKITSTNNKSLFHHQFDSFRIYGLSVKENAQNMIALESNEKNNFFQKS